MSAEMFMVGLVALLLALIGILGILTDPNDGWGHR